MKTAGRRERTTPRHVTPTGRSIIDSGTPHTPRLAPTSIFHLTGRYNKAFQAESRTKLIFRKVLPESHLQPFLKGVLSLGKILGMSGF